MVRVREGRVLVSSVAPPFRTAYWSDLGAIAAQVGLRGTTAQSLEGRETQQRFLNALADCVLGCEVFRPGQVGFRSSPWDIRRAEEFRRSHFTAVFLGNCSRTVVLGALELLRERLRPNGAVDVRFKQSDLLSDWPVGQQLLRDVAGYLYLTQERHGSISFFSVLRDVPVDLWEFLYDRPRIRIGWLATELAGCCDLGRFAQARQENVTLQNLQRISEAGLWPHLVVPVSAANTRILPQLLLALVETTRGGTIELMPVRFLRAQLSPLPEFSAGPVQSERLTRSREAGSGSFLEEGRDPDIHEFVAALSAIYRNARIPLHLVSPLSWVAARIDSEVPLISSPAAAGAEVAVLPSGELYAGEFAVGLRRWRLGNVLADGDDLRWERLDAVPEVFGRAAKPPACQACDWRYRCGGVDAAVALLQEQEAARTGERPVSLAATDLRDPSRLFDLYCAPRKVLFEDALWDSVAATVRGPARRPRERLDLRPDGVEFKPAAIGEEETCPGTLRLPLSLQPRGPPRAPVARRCAGPASMTPCRRSALFTASTWT